MQVIEAAYQSKNHDDRGGPIVTCARCGTHGPSIPVRECVSKNFAGYTDWVCPTGPALCRPCGWSYREEDLRKSAAIVTGAPSLRLVEPGATKRLLSTGAMPADAAVCVPLRPGRQHIIHDARWGCVTVGGGQALPWREQHAEIVRIVDRLRALGAGSKQLLEETPPWGVLAHRSARERAAALADWQALQPWRRHAFPLLDLVIRITVPERKTR